MTDEINSEHDTDAGLVEVEQCDREAAAQFLEADGHPFDKLWASDVRRGARDDHVLVGAFARHRLAALSRPSADFAAVVEQCARVAALWKSSLRPGSEDRHHGHREAASNIAAAIRAIQAPERGPPIG